MAKTLLKAIPLALLLLLPTASRLRAGDEPPKEKAKRVEINDEAFEFDGDDEGPFVFRWGGEAGRGRIGVRLIEITPELRAHYGASRDAGILVAGVEPDSPAAKGGILVGDVITSAGGERVESARDISGAIRGKKKGETVKIDVFRNRAARSLTVTLDTETRREVVSGDLRRRIRDRVRVIPKIDMRMDGLLDRFGDRDRLQERLDELDKRLKDLEKRLPAK